MKLNLKSVSKLAVATLATTSLVACGTSGTNTVSDSITLATWGSSPAELVALESTIASFTEATGITVEVENIQDKYMDVLKARFAAKNAPDVFYLDSFEAPGLAASGVLYDQSSTLPEQEDFYAPLLGAFTGEEGQVWGAPKDYSTLALYVNTDMLAEAGYTSADIPTDMDEFLSFTKELQSKLPDGKGAMLIEKDLARHLDVFDSVGAEVITADGQANFAENVDAKNYIQQLVDGKAEGYLQLAKDDLGSDSAIAAFGAEKAVMMIEGNWSLGAFEQDFADLNFETLELPTIKGNQHTMAFTVGYAINNNAKNLEGAIEFANYMTKEGQAEWTQGAGVLPSRQSVTEATDVDNDPLKSAHIAGAEYATVWSRGTTLPVINTAFGNQFTAALNGMISVEEAVQAMDKEANDEIARQQ
ncbi:MAG: sugar ABC transporter substrate-binding protein [Culicoidibacterales bacterium]